MLDQNFFHDSTKLQQHETEIRSIFTHHITSLCHQKWQIVDHITKWSLTLITQIHEYVAEQRKMLDEVYERKVYYLNTIRDEIITNTMKHVEKNDHDEIDELLKKCSALKLEFATLTYTSRPVSTIKLIVDEPTRQENEDESNEKKAKVESCPQEANTNNENGVTDNTYGTENQLSTAISINRETIK